MPDRTRPGAPAVDAPLDGGWMLDALKTEFQLLSIDATAPRSVNVDGLTIHTINIDTTTQSTNAIRERYLGQASAAIYLIRPDQHVAARWTTFDETAVQDAVRTATGRG